MDAEARAIEIARVNARRRDAEGIDMRPHPGNRLEPAPEESRGMGLYGEKAFAYEGSGTEQLTDKSKGAKEGGAKGKEEDDAEQVYAAGGYECAEYEPAEYDCTEYKSVYDPPK